MPKNLVLINLESVSNAVFRQNWLEMPAVWALMNKSLAFSRFFSASTSTFMSLADLMQGDSCELDHHMLYPSEAGCLLGRSENLFQILLGRGYAARCLRYGTFRDYAAAGVDNYLGLPSGSGVETGWHDDLTAYWRAIGEFLRGRDRSRPFALHLLNLISHVRDKGRLKTARGGLAGVFKAGFALLDRSVRILMEELEGQGILSDTIVVAFGDHGNELWSHGLGKGFMHCLEPYASQCSVPLFIHGLGRSGATESLMSMTDLKATLLRILFPESPEPARATPFSGIDVFLESRGYSFSQNLLALQLEQQDPSRGLVKSYAVTDGTFRLVAASGGDRPHTGGMELFCDVLDPDNTVNLLGFTALDRNGNAARFRPAAGFAGERADALAAKYEELRRILRESVRTKENLALPHRTGASHHLFPEEAFNAVRPPRPWSG